MKMVNVLVAYASKHGSTAEIARMIGETLRINGVEADVRAVQDVVALDGFDAVVLGSAVYNGNWMHEAAEFLEARKDALKKTPLWLFSSGPIGEGDAHQLVDGVVLPESIVKLTRALNVQEQQVFHGKVDLRKLSLAELMLFKSVGARTGDYRHWDMIKLWAQNIRDKLVRARV